MKFSKKVFKLYQNTKVGYLPKNKTNFLLKLSRNQNHSVRKTYDQNTKVPVETHTSLKRNDLVAGCLGLVV